MFINNKLKDKIRNMGSEDEFAAFLNNNPSLIYNMRDDFMNAMHEFGKIYDHVHFGILDALYYNRDAVDETNFDLLESYANSLYPHWILKNEGWSKVYIMMLLFDRNKMININDKDKQYQMHINPDQEETLDLVIRVFLGKLMDLYVASEDPQQVIDSIMKSMTFTEILNNAFDPKFISTRIWDTCGRSECINDAVLLIKHVSDIYTNRSSRLDCFIQLHQMEIGPARFINLQNDMAERYDRYFENEAMTYIVELISYYKGDNLELNLRDFVIFCRDHYDMSAQVLTLFMKDVLSIIQPFTDAYHFASILASIDSILTVVEKYQQLGLDMRAYKANESATVFKKDGLEYALEAYKKDSVAMHKGSSKIYHAYKTYKNAEDKVDSQITKGVMGMKGVLIGDTRSEIIEGKKFSAIGMLKQVLGTVGLFAFGPIKAICALVIKYSLKKSTTISERKKIILELEGEIEMINEKIDDAKSDNDRDAKYAMMRTRTELTNALNRIKYGLEADQRSVATAKGTINSLRGK